jgi:hypothetical protein
MHTTRRGEPLPINQALNRSRLVRLAEAPPLGTIRSLAYFLPVIEEVLGFARQPGLLPISAPEARTDGASTVGSPQMTRRSRADDGNQPAQLRRG